jgi:hypothetical protein
MRHAIALNGSFFTAQRMLQEYMIKAYNNHAAEPAAFREHDVPPAVRHLEDPWPSTKSSR